MKMNDLIVLNKPYGVICQFSTHEKYGCLKDYVVLPDFYPAGRLDTDSEGLLLLTNDGRLQARIADPKFKLEKTYWAQVEGSPDEAKLDMLRRGVDLGDFVTRPAKVRVSEEDDAENLLKALEKELAAKHGSSMPLYEFEPSSSEVLDALLTRYMGSRIRNALLQSAASELASRQQAMHTATDNAEDLIITYTRLANAARQGDITQEITEIVSGADALGSE